MKSFSWALLLLCCALGLLFAPLAHAGEWKLDRYEYTLSSRSTYEHTEDSGKGYDASIPVTKISGVDTHGKIEHPKANQDSGISFGAELHVSSTRTKYAPKAWIPAKAYVTLTVTPIFVWQSKSIVPSRSNTSGETPNPNDNPPAQLWYREYVATSGKREDENQRHNQATPSTGKHFSMGFDSGLKTSLVPATGPTNRMAQVNCNTAGSNVVRIDSHGAEMVSGTSRTLKARVELTTDGLRETHNLMERRATIKVYYRVDYVHFEARGRIKSGHEETELSQNWSVLSLIEAGRIASPDGMHQGDVLVIAKWGDFPNFTPLADLSASLLPHISLSRKEGIESAATIEYRGGKTDARGYILGAVVTTRDLIGNSATNNTIGAVLSNIPNAEAQFETTWGQIEWRLGENGQWPWPLVAVRPSEEYTNWVWAKLTGVAQRPLVGHRFKIQIQKLVVEVTEPVTFEKRIKFFTRDSNEAQSHDGDVNTDVICKDDLGEVAKDYISLPAEGKSDSLGICKGQFTLKVRENVVVNNFTPYLRDLDVYQK